MSNVKMQIAAQHGVHAPLRASFRPSTGPWMYLLRRPLVGKAITIPFNAPHDPFCQLLHRGYFLVSGGSGGGLTLLNKDGERQM